MVKKIFTILFFIISSSVFCQSEFEKIRKEIEGLNGAPAIENYWVNIFTNDQLNNGGGTDPHDDSLDVLNLFRVSLMIEKFDYPTIGEYNYPANMVPWIVWSHCPATSLKRYTFPYVVKAKELNQLPEGFFPNYFVGGFLLNSYGLDMEFDGSFNSGTESIITIALQHLVKDAGTIDPQKVEKMAQAYLLDAQLPIKKELGEWTTVQHDNITYFKIVQLQNNNWYLSSRTDKTTPVLKKALVSKKLKRFDLEEGLDLFYFAIENTNTLELRNAKGSIIKTFSNTYPNKQ